MADVKCLEHSTLKVPYELLNKKFRTAQKNIDREISHVQNATCELERCIQLKPGGSVGDVSKVLDGAGVSVGDVSKVLDGVVEKLSVLKRKAEESIQDESEAAQSCRRRLEHLKEYENMGPTASNQWRKKRLDRMLVEYCLRAGYYTTALNLARHSDIQDLTNIDLFLVSKEVEDSLERRETAKCLAWCHDNKSKLRKMKSTLEFNLRQQEFVELIRNDRRLEAVKHARKYFTNLEDNQLEDVQRVMALLAFSPDVTILPYKELLDMARWQDLVHQFRHENFKLHQLNSHCIYTVTLEAGLSALKTPQCYKADVPNRNKDCPVCSKNLNELAQRLPYAHCAQSRLICSISGEPLNEHNPPMALPNGHVYGYNSLVTMAAQNEGKIVCPQTKDIYNLEEMEKVFVM